MVQLSDISLNFGQQIILEHANLSLRPGQKLGLVGSNGTGKTTLFRLISGQLEASEGRIIIPKDLKVGYLPQEIRYQTSNKPLLENVLEIFDYVYQVEDRMRQLEHRISEDHSPALLHEYDELQLKFDRLNGYSIEARCKEILCGLGFKPSDFTKKVCEFSGGWQMRISLAKILLEDPGCLLLDEPTNHLDIDTLVWLENFLKKFSGMLILVSHDRYFLDSLVTHIAEVDHKQIQQYTGNYTQYELQKEQRLELLIAAAKNQQQKVAHLEQFIDRFRYKSTKAKQVQSRIKQLEKIQDVDVPESSRAHMNFSFQTPQRSGDPVYLVDNLSFSYSPDTKLIEQSNLEIRRGDKLALVGPNGIGKSTLLKLINGSLEPVSGHHKVGHHVKLGYFEQHHLDQLNAKNIVLDEVWESAESMTRPEIRGLLGRFLFSGEDVEKPVSVLSGGEKSRIVLMKLLLSHANFLILDEPTNHLDMQSKEVLASALKNFEGTVLIVSHDRYFLDMLVNKVISFKDHQLCEFLGNYSDYEKQNRELTDNAIHEQENTSRNSRKEQKRQEAKARQKKYQEQKDLKKEYDALEKEIDVLSKRQGEILDIYASPEFLAYSILEMKAVSSEENDVKDSLSQKEERWLELHEILDL